MFRTTGFALAALAAVAAWSATEPATAQERGGLRQRGPSATLDQIEANRGCPLSNTSVTFGVNRAFGNGSAAQQQLGHAECSGTRAAVAAARWSPRRWRPG